MSFEWPLALLGLALLPLMLGVYLLAQRRRSKYALRFTNLDLLANVVHKAPNWRRHVPPILYLLALAALVVALARPEVTISSPREEATIMLVTDISRSMIADDVAPSRLEAAKTAAQRFVDKVPERFRVGIVAFDDKAQVVSPPTRDRETVRAGIDGLQPGEGTAIGEGLDRALGSLRQSARTRSDRKAPPAVIVLLSDGKTTHGRDARDVARRAKQMKVPVNTIALGTPSGVVRGIDAFGQVQELRVPPDPETLRDVARTSGGRFFSAFDADRVSQVYDDLGSRIGYVKERREITAGFAGAGLALMLVGGMLGLAWFSRLP